MLIKINTKVMIQYYYITILVLKIQSIYIGVCLKKRYNNESTCIIIEKSVVRDFVCEQLLHAMHYWRAISLMYSSSWSKYLS